MRTSARWVALAALACSGAAPQPDGASAPAEEPPVALNAEPAVQYPPDLFDRRIEGDVVLRLFADSTGQLAPESTRVAETSGHAAFDSAAVRGVSGLRYAPARRRGLPVATSFLQTIEFRRPSSGAGAPVEQFGARPDSVPVARDTLRPRRAPLDSAPARRDTGSPPQDSTTASPDTAKAGADSSGGAS